MSQLCDIKFIKIYKVISNNPLHYSARVSITKYHRLGDLHNRKFFTHSSIGCKYKTKVPAEWVSENFLFSSCRQPPSPRVLASPLLCLFVYYKDAIPIGLGPAPHFWPHLTLIFILKFLSPNIVILGLGLQFWILGNEIQFITSILQIFQKTE